MRRHHALDGHKGLLIRPLLRRLRARWQPASRTWHLPNAESLERAELAAKLATDSVVRTTSHSIARHLAALGCARRGAEVRFSCPAHHDQQPSASFNVTRGVWHCFGCGARGGALELARALGIAVELATANTVLPTSASPLDPPAAFAAWAPSSEPDGSALFLPRLGSPSRAYEVRDSAGRLFAVHARFEVDRRKLFRWWRNGAWNLGGVPVAAAPLWGSERLAAALHGPVYVTEGEKAAAALLAAGASALGTVTGASGTPGAVALEVLAGRRVILWPDADDVGRAHMARIAALLAGRCEVKTVATGARSDGFDAADWLAVRSGRFADGEVPEDVEMFGVD